MHDRGSQGSSGELAGVGGWKSALAPDYRDGSEVPAGADEEVLDPVVPVGPATVPVGAAPADPAAPAGPVVTGAGGGFTENCEPVTTVTSAPKAVGPSAVTTAPESDLATFSAAASAAGVFDA